MPEALKQGRSNPNEYSDRKDNEGGFFVMAHAALVRKFVFDIVAAFLQVGHFRRRKENEDAPCGWQKKRDNRQSDCHPANKRNIDMGEAAHEFDDEGVGA